MKRLCVAVAVAGGSLLAAGYTAAQVPGRDAQIGYPDFGYMPQESERVDRVFQLSQDFPQELPPLEPELEDILAINFKKEGNWKDYLNAIQAYIFEGNIDQPGYKNDFDPHRNDVRGWYHMPWMHWGPQGREGVHGLTREGPLAKKMLGPDQTKRSHAYAVGIFNARGGYPIGQVWHQPGQPPDLSYFETNKGFPNGTVIAKLLFTPLGETQVDWLKNPLTWQAYVVTEDIPGCNFDACANNRAIADVHLLQMDIMIRDDRANATGGWVFGTYTYNGRLDNENKWDNLVPVGLMWGNDPDARTSEFNTTPNPQQGTLTNPALDQTFINKSDDLPAMHLGWGYRLNGPADNPKSSCMSCHSTAQYPNAAEIMPILADGVSQPAPGTKASDAWMRWFRNEPWGTAFDKGEGVVNMDFSLQLSKSLKRYVEYVDKVEDAQYSAQFWHEPNKIRRNVLE